MQTTGMLLVDPATGELAVRTRRVRKLRAENAACLAMIADTRELAATHALEDVIDEIKS